MSATIRGYASLFGRIDATGDRVEPGAYRRTLAQRGAGGIRMLWQHDPAEPIGVWTALRETREGLWAEGRISPDTRRGRDAAALLADGAIDGLSIGFRARGAERAGGAGGLRRRLTDIDLWEISLVTFPMQDAARVEATRAVPRDFVERLADAARRILAPPPVRARRSAT